MSRHLVAVPAYQLVTGRVAGWHDEAAAVPQSYLNALQQAGITAVILAASTIEEPAELLSSFSGLVLLGGGDVDPARYREARHPRVYGVIPARDDLELALARLAVANGLPVLGICRGLQVLNVAFGGTLHQHLPDHGLAGHSEPDADGLSAVHDVLIEPGSRLAGLLGGAGDLTGCVSVHHQAANRVAESLTVSAWSSDGVVEALESRPDAGWLLAVQWHPERSAASDPHQQALFSAFGEAVRQGTARDA